MEKQQQANRMPPMHQGKWTPEEEAYVEVLVSAFKAGVVPIPDGTTLRVFLCSMLNCPAKRISKKFVGSGYNGKRAYVRKHEGEYDPKVAKNLHKKLREMEQKFLKSLAPLIDFHEQANKDKLREEMQSASASASVAGDMNQSRGNDAALAAHLKGQLPVEKLKPTVAAPTAQAAAGAAQNGNLQDVLNSLSIRRLEGELRSMTDKAGQGPARRDSVLPTNTQPSTNDMIMALLGQRVPASGLSLRNLDVAGGPSSSALLNSLQQKFGNTQTAGLQQQFADSQSKFATGGNFRK